MIKVGKIVKPQGIKGEVKIAPADANTERYLSAEKLLVNGKEMAVKSIVARQGFLFVFLEGITDRNAAELLRGAIVEADDLDVKALNKNEFYFDDLIGKDIVFENGKKAGTLEDIEQFGAADNLIIRSGSRLWQIPFVDEFVKEISVSKIVVYEEKFNNFKI